MSISIGIIVLFFEFNHNGTIEDVESVSNHNFVSVNKNLLVKLSKRRSIISVCNESRGGRPNNRTKLAMRQNNLNYPRVQKISKYLHPQVKLVE
jgi:hypothetical protein